MRITPALRHRLPLLTAATIALAAAVGLAVPARSQGLDDDEPEAPAQAQPQVMFSDQNFDQWVFGNGRNAATARSHLGALFELKIDEVDRVARLTEAQKRKLALAAVGDVKRFFDVVEEKRKAFQLVRNDQQKFQEFFQELRPLQSFFLQGGAFADGSLFTKTLKKTLDEGQVSRYEEVVRERRLLQYRARIGMVLANLDNTLGLTADQRRRLSKLIADEVRPPKRPSGYDSYVILYQLARMPEERLKAIFNEAQWKVMSQQFGNLQMFEATLIKQDVLPDDLAAGATAKKPTPGDAKNESRESGK